MKTYGWKEILFRAFPVSVLMYVKDHSFLASLQQKEAMLQFRKCLGSPAAGLDALEKKIFEPLSKFELRSFAFL